MGVPIFRLPFLALKVVVDHFDRAGLVTVSVLSKRADRILKICGKKILPIFDLLAFESGILRDFQKLALLLLADRRQRRIPVWNWNFAMSCYMVFEKYFSISCRYFHILIYIDTLQNIEKSVGVRVNLKIGESFVPVVITTENDGVEKISTFWSSEADGMIALIDYFKNNFDLSIGELKLAGKDTTAIRTVVNHINTTQTLVRRVLVGFDSRVSDDDFKFILTTSATDRFSSRLKPSTNFQFNGKIHARSLEIQNGHWFTIASLLKCTESEEIRVDGSDYTKEELRTFLRGWKAGKLPKLKSLKLQTKVPCLDVIEGFKRMEEGCRERDNVAVVVIRGDANSHGCVQKYYNNYYSMSIHDNE